VIWQGAEYAVTNRWDKRVFFDEENWRIGSNAREHCRLFATASKAAMAIEMSDEIEDDRVIVDGMLANLLNVRGCDAESVAEKKAIGAKETRTVEEAAAEVQFKTVILSADALKARREQKLRRKEKIKKLKKLTPPDKPNHHEVFVRITRQSSGEVVSQGFCEVHQKLPWWVGLDNMARKLMPRGPWHGLQILLDFESLKQSEEIQSLQDLYSSGGRRISRDMAIGFEVMAVMIDKRNHSVRCLFQQDRSKEIEFRKVDRGYHFYLDSEWGREDMIQLGPLKDGGFLVLPSLEVDIQPDMSVLDHAHMRLFEPGFTPVHHEE